MKTRPILYGLLLTFLCLRAIPQSYDSLVVENAQWQIQSYTNDPPAGADYKDGWLLRGDTMINEIQYKKLFRRHFESVNSNDLAWQGLYGYLREDVVNKKVYALESDGFFGCNETNSEYLLFDFSYQVGDTSQMCMHNEWYQNPVVLEEIYYEFLFGEERRLYRFDFAWFDLIEGVGHKNGLLEPIMGFESYYLILYDYCRGTDEECGVQTLVDENPGRKLFSIYPNPASGNVIIHFNDKQDVRSCSRIILTDIYGRCVLADDNPCQDVNVDVSGFAEGVYFIGIINDENDYAAKKLIISR